MCSSPSIGSLEFPMVPKVSLYYLRVPYMYSHRDLVSNPFDGFQWIKMMSSLSKLSKAMGSREPVPFASFGFLRVILVFFMVPPRVS